MKLFCVVALVVVVAVCGEEKYTTENDNLDIDAVVKNTKTLEAFADCFLDIGYCDAVTADFKKDMLEAIQQACGKCTDAQKHIFKGFLIGLKQQLPAKFTDYKKKYDPDNKYFAALEAAVANS